MRSIYILFFLFTSSVCLSQNGGQESENKSPNNFHNTESIEVKEEGAEELLKEQPKNKSYNPTSKKADKRKSSKQIPANQTKEVVKKLEYDYKAIRTKAQSATTKTVDVVSQRKMNGIVSELRSSDAQSVEYHKIKYLNGNHDVRLFKHLEKAYAVNPKDKEVLQLMISFYDIKGDAGRVSKISRELKAVKPFSKETYDYLKNVLNSIPKNGVLITHGSLDTYPLFILTEVDGFRKDVTIISLDLLQSTVYREKLRRLNFQIPERGVVDTKFLRSFCELNENKNIYLSMTIPKNYFKEIPSNIYITGLAFKYSRSTISNVLELKDNWSKFEKNLFENDKKPNNESVALISNYLLPLIVLKKYYEKETMFRESEALGAYIQKVSRWQNQEGKVQDILRK